MAPDAERGEPAVVLATKLAAPSTRARLVDRAPLIERLCAQPGHRLTLLSAPAGWGKTTLLAQWVANSQDVAHFGWLSLDSSENDPKRFWTCVIAALRKANPSAAHDAYELLQLGADLAQVVLPTLLNELAALGEQIVLILDDYHVVNNRTVHELVTFVLERMPATLRLVVATRVDPLLPLARLRARGDLLEVRTDDLRFAAGEAMDLLTGVVGLDLTTKEVELLLRRTEGWAAGLYLAALSLDRRVDAVGFVATFAGDNRHIVDYLIAEVLAGQSAGRRAFLLRTSVLDRLNGSLCDAMLEAADSAAVLQEMEQQNLFVVPLDLSRRWYRYHHLFAELLRAELHRTEPDLVASLHRRAGSWLATEGLVDDALRHLAAAGEVEQCADLIAANWVSEFNQGRLLTVSCWLDLLAEETVTNDPRLGTIRAWIALNFGDLDAGAVWIAAVEAAALSDTRGEDFVAQLAVLRAVHKFRSGEVAVALEKAAQAISGGVGDAPMTMSGGYCVGAHCVYGSALYYSGRVGEAEDVYRHAVQLAEMVEDHSARIYCLGYLALIAAEDGRLDEARQQIQRVTGNGGDINDRDQFVGLMVSLATAIMLDMRGDARLALGAAEVAVVSARRGGAIPEVAKALVVRAHILEHLGERKAAQEDRQEAAALLRGRAVPGLAGGRGGLGLKPCTDADHSITVGEELTDKELEVLRLLDTLLSRREIGERLYIALNTVKTHQRMLYRKLGVDSRTAAVHRARQLGLL
jgi:LuxR family maltose regulon positive regulatory protein